MKYKLYMAVFAVAGLAAAGLAVADPMGTAVNTGEAQPAMEQMKSRPTEKGWYDHLTDMLSGDSATTPETAQDNNTDGYARQSAEAMEKKARQGSQMEPAAGMDGMDSGMMAPKKTPMQGNVGNN